MFHGVLFFLFLRRILCYSIFGGGFFMIPFEIWVYMNKHPESLVEKDGSRVVTVPGLMRREYVSCPDLRHDGVLCHYFNMT